MTLSDLIASLLPDQRAIGRRAQDATGHGYGHPLLVLQRWAFGRGGVPRTKIANAALLIGCTPDQVAMACYGVSAAEAIATRGGGIERRRHAGKLEARARADKRRNGRPLSFRERSALGLVDAGERERHRVEKRAREALVIHSATHCIMLDGRPVSMAHIRSELKAILRRLRTVDRRLAGFGRRFNKPWHLLGFLTLDAWAASDPVAADGSLRDRRHCWQVLSNARRARLAKAGGSGVSPVDWYEIMRTWEYKCAYCGIARADVRDRADSADMEMDHVVPIPIGPHSIANIVPACKPCNSSKADSDLIAWAARRRIYLSDRVLCVYAAISAPASKP